jgi:Holliday junction resolvase RusA-like endonuclease
MKIILPEERPMSWNKLYAGKHWIVRQQEALRIHMLVRQMTRHVTEKFAGKVRITLTAYFKSSPLDADNIADKFYIDGLRHSVIVDDNYKWIDSVTTRSRVDKENPRVEIEITEIDGKTDL